MRRLAGLAALACVACGANPSPQAERPRVALLTSLPILFGEGFALSGPDNDIAKTLEQRFRLAPIASTEAAALRDERLLLLAHPRAQTAEALVALDRWLRRGGRLLLLADPASHWPSARPLGDPLRPPPWFADTGLLRHWGLALDAPDNEAPVRVALGGQMVETIGVGRLRAAPGGSCALADQGLVARCQIGRGMAVVIADADLLNDSAGVAAVSAELESLARR